MQAEEFGLPGNGRPSPCWIKVKNPRYSQAEGPEELFEIQSVMFGSP
jgi:hypothetical protein